MRLAVVSTAIHTNKIVEEIERQSGGRIEVVLNIGRENNHFKATSLSRLLPTKGTEGHLVADRRYSGGAQALLESSDFLQSMEEFIDHLHRTCDINTHKSHPLRTMHDYIDYYHVLADSIGREMIDRGVTHVLFFNAPHLAFDTVVYQVAKSLGLPTIVMFQSLFPGRYFSMRDPKDMGLFPHREGGSIFPIEKGSNLDLHYMAGIKQERGESGRLTLRAVGQIVTFLAMKRPAKLMDLPYVFGLMRRASQISRRLPSWRDPFARFFHEDAFPYFEKLANLEDADVNLEGDFVYFPLQLQPELTTSALGGGFRDQAYAIERLASILPEGVRILVKENPKQGSYMRGPLFFHRLDRIPSVTLLPSWANTHQLTANAKFVATITGTVGWEAIRQGKPVLVFGKAWYRRLPGAFEFREGMSYEDIARAEIDHAQLEKDMGALLEAAHEGVTDVGYAKLWADYDEAANNSGIAETAIGLLEGRIDPSFASHFDAG